MAGWTLEQMCAKPAGWKMYIDWRWRNDSIRARWKKAAKKGYYSKHSARGMDEYTRTDKPMVEGDSLKKSIHMSWPDMSKCPKSLVAIVNAARENYERSMKEIT